MQNHEIARLRDLPIEGVAQRLGIGVEHHKSLCPFHADQHPSLTYYAAKNSYHCFVCGAHGGVIDLVMHQLHKPFVEACQWLADEHNVILSAPSQPPAEVGAKRGASRTFDPARYRHHFEHPTLTAAAQDFLYGQRKLDPRVVKWCRLSSYTDRRGTDWLQIPYFDVDGNLIGVQSRNLSQTGPRFRFPYGTTCHIYNLPVLRMLRQGEPLYIAEGASDCWSLLSSGHKAIAIPSATLLNRKDLHLLKSFTTQGEQTAQSSPLSADWHMYPDADIPGEKLYIQLLHVANQLGACLTRHTLPIGCKDYSDYYLLQLRGV